LLVKYWSNTGQILVKYWSNTDRIAGSGSTCCGGVRPCWSNTGQELVKHGSNTGQKLVKLQVLEVRAAAVCPLLVLVKNWSNNDRTLVDFRRISVIGSGI
jgi:uncharacterized protein YfaP (DUF2135 family)